MRKIFFYSGYFLFLTTGALFSVEFFSRILLKDLVNLLVNDERSLTYTYDSLLGWFPEKNSQKKFKGSREILLYHNRRGFRDKDPQPKVKPRILFLGDSFVWGFDVEKEERFTEKLQRQLNGAEVLNFGISGYGTDQEFLLLQKEYEVYKPDLVFLMFSPNDRRDNSFNSAYGYFKPYFVKENGKLVLHGVPVPKSSLCYLRNNNVLLRKSVVVKTGLLIYEKIRTKKIKVEDPTAYLVKEMGRFLENKGAKLVIGFIDSDAALMEYCRQEHIVSLDLTQVDERYRFPSHGKHWTEKGHELVSGLIYQFLQKNNFLAGASTGTKTSE